MNIRLAWPPRIANAIEKLSAPLRRRGLVSLFVPIATFLIYVRTLAPGVLPGDGGEFQFAAWGWTLPHPTGYPLYLIVGGIWQHIIPIGDAAYRLNLLSAVFSALTAFVCYRIYVDVAGHRGAALVAVLTFAVSPTFWSQATESEVYALNTLFIALLTRFALKWQERRDFIFSAAWACTFGLSLTHHRSIILLIPAFAAFFAEAVYERAHRIRFWQIPVEANWLRRDAAYGALILAPLLLYAYIPLRAPLTPYTNIQVSPEQVIRTFDNTPAGWISFIAGSSFESVLDLNRASLNSLLAFPSRLISEFNPLGLAIGLAGLIALGRQRRFGLIALTFFGMATVVIFNSSYHIGDIADFYTPAYFFFAIWIAAALGATMKFVATHGSLKGTQFPTIIILIAAAALPIENLFASFVQEDRSLHTEWHDRWETVLHSELAQNAILISNDRDEITPMWYLQIVDGLSPDAIGLFPKISSEVGYSNVMRLVDSVVDSGRPVFLIKSIPGVALRYRLDPAEAGLVKVASAQLPAPRTISAAILGDKLKVTGFTVSTGVVRTDSEFTISVYWLPLVQLTRDYTASLQLFARTGEKVAQGNDHPPGGDTYPTSLWRPGETLRDTFAVTMPAGVSRGIYHVLVKVYDPQTGETVGDLTEIGNLRVVE